MRTSLIVAALSLLMAVGALAQSNSLQIIPVQYSCQVIPGLPLPVGPCKPYLTVLLASPEAYVEKFGVSVRYKDENGQQQMLVRTVSANSSNGMKTAMEIFPVSNYVSVSAAPIGAKTTVTNPNQ
jgi:hypothetical protein